MNRTTGRYEWTAVAGEEVAAFLPLPLPPRNPALDIEGSLAEPLRSAEHALARLDLAGEMVPSLDWFVYAFVRKEAVITSQIEGAQASLVDLLTHEAQSEAAPDRDVEEVCNYLEALSYARAELARPDGLPLSVRLLNESHPAADERCARGKQAAGRDTAQSELDRRHPAGQRGSCASAAAIAPRASGRSRKIPSCRGRAATAGADRACACPVRDHPPLSRRQRAPGPTVDRPPARTLGSAEIAAPLSQPVLQAAPRGVLPAAQRGPDRRRLGRLDRLFPRRRRRDRRGGRRFGAPALRPDLR